MIAEQLLREAPADTVISLPGAPRPSGTRSYLADDRVIAWRPAAPPGVRVAVDAEIACQPVPGSVARRFGRADPATFWPQWTAIEVACKLHDIGLLAWFSRFGFWYPPTIPMRTTVLGDVVMTWGVLT